MNAPKSSIDEYINDFPKEIQTKLNQIQKAIKSAAPEKEMKPKAEFVSLLGAPAKRALESKGISTLKQLTACSEEELLAFHGMGPGSIP